MQERSTQPTQRRRRRWWLPLLILSVAGAAAAALIATKPERRPVKVLERAWLVAVEDVHAARYAASLTLYGRVESQWSSELTAGIAADIERVAVVEGDRVEQGQLLVRLDDRDVRLELAQREAELQQAEARIAAERLRHEADLAALPRERHLLSLTRGEVNRLQDLVKNKVGAQSQLDTAMQAAERQAIALTQRQQAVDEHTARLAEVEATRARAEALRDQALLELQRCEVRAPYNGRVARLPAAPGRRVRVGAPLISLYASDDMLVRAQLPTRHLPQIRSAMNAGEPLVAHGEIDGIRVVAQLRGLAAESDANSGGVDGLFTVTEGAQEISQGRFVRIELQLPARDGLAALPHEAIYGTDRVYLVDEDSRMRAQRIERVGEVRLDNGETRVLVDTAALPAAAKVVVTQLPNALDGLLIRVADER